MKRTIQMLVVLLLGLVGQLKAQTTINSSSHSVSIDGQFFEYSIGEMTLVNTSSNSNLIISQGFLQPNSQKESPSGVIESIASSSNIRIYPNPTENEVFIESDETLVGKVELTLYDALGKLIISQQEKQLEGNNKYKMSLQAYSSGNYFLLITKLNHLGKAEKLSFKIQKIN